MSILFKIGAFQSCFRWQIFIDSGDENIEIIEYTLLLDIDNVVAV